MMEWKDLPVVHMTAFDCTYVCTNMRDADFSETSALTYDKTRDAMAKSILNQGGESYTILNKKNQPVLIGGAYYDNPRVATIWLFATDKITIRDWWVTTQFITGLIDRMIESETAHRVQVLSIGWRHVAHKWFPKFGLNKEAHLKHYAEDGSDVLIFSKVKE
tara:strand:- start:747 stop:1232 length:486 start_codon:yes stop_codon:yes gene_type:complete